MTVGFTALTSGSDTTNTTAPYTTATVTPTANQPVLVAVFTSTNATATPTASVSGCGLTWTLVDNTSISSRTAWIFLGIGASPTAGALSIAGDSTTVMTGCLWQVTQCSAVDTSTASGVVQSANAKPGSATSASVAFNNPVASTNGTFAAVGIAVQASPTAGTGWTAAGVTNQSQPVSGLLGEYAYTAQQNITASWATATSSFVVGVELQAASGTAATATGSLTLGGSATGTSGTVPTGTGGLTLGGTATATVAATPDHPGPALYPLGSLFPGASTFPSDTQVVPDPPGPPDHPPRPKVQLPDQGAQGLLVAFYDLDYQLQGYANDYESCAVTFQNLDTGTGSLVLSETSPLVPLANLAGQQPVPVTVTDRNGNRWSGRVDSPSTDEGDGSSQTVPGSGLTTITLVDEWVWFKRLLAAPWGASTQMAYGSGDPEFDVRTGPIHTTVKGYITDALKRVYGLDVAGNPLGPIVVVPPPSSDGSTVVTLQAKWTPIADLVTDTLRSLNWALTIRLWLPGDVQPVGLVNPLTGPTLVVDMHVGANNPWIIWDDDNFLTRKVAVKSPASFGGVFGGDGSGTTQTFSAYTDDGLKASQGAFGFPEQFFSSSTTSSPQAQLEATEGALAVDATVRDGAPWTFGADYAVGDLVGVRALGLDIRERVTAVQMVDDRDNGYRLVPTIGDDAATLTPTQRLFKTVRELGSRVASLETGS